MGFGVRRNKENGTYCWGFTENSHSNSHGLAEEDEGECSMGCTTLCSHESIFKVICQNTSGGQNI